MKLFYQIIYWLTNSCLDVFCKKGVLKILQNSQENTCPRISFVNKVTGLRLQFYITPLVAATDCKERLTIFAKKLHGNCLTEF